MMKKFLIVFLICISQNIFSQEVEQILSKTIEKVSSIHCVSYKKYSTYSAPFDSLAFNSDTCFIEYITNRGDSIMGSSFLSYYDDTSKISFYYHKNISIRYSWDNRIATIDTVNPEHITLMAPFLTAVKSLLSYASENKDSTECQVTDFKDSLQITFLFKNKLIEFGLNPFIYPKKGAQSKYTLWVDKDLLPYSLIRKMPHQTSIERISYLSFIKCNNILENQVGVYILDGFTIQDRKGIKIMTNEIESQMAFNFILENVDGDTVKLADFKGKNLLIEFTSVGCGPCHLSVPFLKRIAGESKTNDFKVVSIEIYPKNRSKSGLKRYRDINQINYEFLITDKETIKKYKIYAPPTFVFVNRMGLIEKVIVGYSKDKTDIEIINLMNKMK